MDSNLTTPHRQLAPAPLVGMSRTLDFDRFNSELDEFSTDPYARSENSKTPNIRTDPTKEPKPHGHGHLNRIRKSASFSSDLENKENGGSPISSKISHETRQSSSDSLASKHLVAQNRHLREENERLEEETRMLRAEIFTYRQLKESEVLHEFLQIATDCGKANLLEKGAVVLNYGGEGDVVSNTTINIENTDFVFSGPTNPLEVDLILMNVMKFLKPIDLQKCRLVSKSFNHFASKELSKSHSHVFIKNSTTALHFTKVMQKTNGFPYSKLLLKDKCVSRTRIYLSSFGSYIKTLKIVVKNRLKGPDFINFENVSNVLSSMPNLEELVLDGLDHPQIETQDLVPLPPLPLLTRLSINNEFVPTLRKESASRLLSRLFAATPSLTSLSASSSGECCQVSETLIETLITIPSITELELTGFRYRALGGLNNLTPLYGAIFRLKKLRIEIYKWDSEGMSKFLETQAQSLEELEMKVFTDENPPTFEFPKFRKLRSLQLFGYKSIVFPIRRTSIQKSEFPALTHLTLDDTFFNAFTSSPTPSITTLVIRHVTKKHALNDVIRSGLRVPFPNLIKLHLYNPKEKVIVSTLASCSFLEELIIELNLTYYWNWNQVDDFNIEKCLTGMTDSGWLGHEIRELGSKNKIIQFSAIEFLRGVAHRKKGARLANLTNLKRLKIINNEPRYEPAKVGDLTGYLSLLEIQKLDYLYIREGKLSESCIKALKSYHKVVVIDTIPPHAKN